MKVAFHVDQLFFSAPGGIGTYIRHLIPALAAGERPVDVVAFHTRFEGVRPERWLRDYPSVELAASIRTTYPRWNLTGRPALPSELSNADIVHAPLPAAIPPAARGQGLVVTVHDLAFERFPDLFPTRWRWLFRSGLRATIRRADAIIVPSESTAADLEAHSKRAASRIRVIPEATALPTSKASTSEALERLGLPQPYVLSVGTIEPRKNLVRLVRAYRSVADRIPHALVLAGPTGWQGDELQREIDEPGPGRVILTGRLTDDDLDIVYRSSAAVAYVSLYEGFGLPVLEAMHRGLPVIASDSSSVPEVTGSDGAMLVDPHSEESIAAALELVLTDAATASRLAAAGVERSRRFSWDTAAAATRAVYEEACRANR